ncbi:type II toxin-antitoxin system VapB family antitoxin [Azospirillum halopraeferens]|uniref:type II toxin-antitoxin system VapB family antitoxin n=1 Tax=Azospirillum halopraeferens TaxID=34010 RepID=UPI0003F83E39|nr:type II toxin-antitoxin system VapB family antitoxin [Azospirillum halopraeferens]
MSITIKNREADSLLAELKAATGKGASQLVLELLRREAQRLRARRVRSADDAEARMAQLHRELAARPVLDPRAPDDILDYDDSGLPR